VIRNKPCCAEGAPAEFVASALDLGHPAGLFGPSENNPSARPAARWLPAHSHTERRLSQAVSVIALYFTDLCGVDMSPP
jgi:hypothetical protein